MPRRPLRQLVTSTALLVMLSAPALADTPPADTSAPAATHTQLPARSPDDVAIEAYAYWGNARAQNSGGNFRLTLMPAGCHYVAETGGQESDNFYFDLSPADYAAYKLVRDNRLSELPASKQMVYDSFGDESIRVTSPAFAYRDKTIDVDVHNNANNRIDDARWAAAFSGLRAVGEAARARKAKEGAFRFELIRDPSIKGQTVNSRISGASNADGPISLLPGKYKVSLRVWPKGMQVYDETRLLPWDGELSIPAVKQLVVNVVDGKVVVTEKR